jgi:aspartyl/asparaginyl beta-hydroxylase (cupin superfamily)
MNAASKQAQPWYEIFGGRYPGTEPFFFDPADFEWTTILRDNWQVIRDEMQQLLENEPSVLRPYFSETLVYPPRQWKTIGFYFWKWRLHGNCARCPRTVEILDSIPYLTGGSLSILEPGANINPHQGDTNAQIKGHLALSIPARLPDCGFQVGDDIREWHEGELLLFCDAHRHCAWNHSTQRRFVFIIDVIRPEFAHRTNAICAHVLASTALQVVYQRVGWLNRLPGRVHHLLHFFLRGALRAALPVQRRLAL